MEQAQTERIPASSMDSRVFLVGPRFAHHSSHSGYEGFAQYVGRYVETPVTARWFRGPAGWIINQSVRTLFRHRWYSPGSLVTEWHTRRHLKEQKRCLYHVLYGDYDLRWLPLLDRSSNLLIASFHQPTAELGRNRILKRVVRRLDAAVLVSRAQAEFFEGLLPGDRIFVVPHGIDTSFFRPDPGIAKRPRTIIVVGSHLRDFVTLADAIVQVWRDYPQARFKLVGTGRDKAIVSSIGADPRLNITGKLSDEDLRAAYQASTVALFAFTNATASNAVLEALASGLPIVATDVGGARDYLDDESAMLCPSGDSESLAAAVVALLRDPAMADKKSQAARVRSKRYDYRAVAKDLVEVYATLLQS